jgi:hypothetical protein
MNGSEIVLVLLALRVVIPFGLLMLVGEWMRRRDANYWLRM